MNAACENPQIPPSLAAAGCSEPCAETWGLCETHHVRMPSVLRLQVIEAIDRARGLLEVHGRETDGPDPRAVEAADWLDMATVALVQPPELFDAIKGPGGGL